MAIYNQVDLPLYDDADYSYSVSLQSQSYVIRVYYVERTQLWYFSVFEENQTPIFQGLALVPEYPITLDYLKSELTGFFRLVPIPAYKIVDPYLLYPDKIAQYYTFSYVYQ